MRTALYMIAVSAAADGYVEGQAKKALYATILGPIVLTVLLMFVSGMNLSERPGAKKRFERGVNWVAYERYLNRTSILIPFPPSTYERFPTWIKRTLFLDFPLYVFDPTVHSDAVKALHSGEIGGLRPSSEGLVSGQQSQNTGYGTTNTNRA
jgi:hypothetical protein